MATATTSDLDLTPKQAQVFEGLQDGLTPPQIAKRMKISPNGVYGHIARIRDAGIKLPESAGKPTRRDGVGAAKAAVTRRKRAARSSNGSSPVLVELSKGIGGLIEKADDRMAEIDKEMDSIDAERNTLDSRKKALSEEHELLRENRENLGKATL
jgi:hypothetical protein